MNPLHSLHERANAEFQGYAEVPIVSTFGQPQAEYAAIRKAAALFDQPYRGVLELTGKDRLPFLNNLLTNAIYDKQAKSGLAPHGGVYAFFLNVKGRIAADMNVLELGNRTWLELDRRMIDPVRQMFQKYLFAEQVSMNSRAEVLHELFLTGPKALEVLNSVLESPIAELPSLSSAEAKFRSQAIVVFRDDPCGVPGYTLIVPNDAAEAIWTHLTAEPSDQTSTKTSGNGSEPQDYRFKGLARPVGWAAFNATRIEAGRPLFGIDFDESVLPAETAQLSRAVSFTKGCYLGQEIVARMQARGQLARQLTGIKMEGDALPMAGNKIYDADQNEIGGITSSTLSPILSNLAICLGYVKKPFLTPGTRVHVPAEGALRIGTVTELPFIS
ncbi:MAG: aminomethyltransferase family protein [Bacillota bacterium]